MTDYKKIAQVFGLDMTDIAPLGIGNINASFLATCREGRYVLQKINTDVFRDPYAMMENIRMVTEHLTKKITEEGGNAQRETLRFAAAADGTLCHTAADGNVYRMYGYVDDVVTIQSCKNAEEAYRTAYTFGKFQQRLADFNPDVLTETIPDFHHTGKRFATFSEIVAKDPHNRAAEVRDLIAFAERESYLADALIAPLQSGELPLRVTHNDTKINNVLFDANTGEGLCVIDLDTVMPATALYDFGDMVRSGANTTEEDNTRLDTVKLDMAYYKAFLKGFVDGTGGRLTDAERTRLALSAKVLAFELAIRFLGDYINGDVYFSIRKPGHNKDRAANQLQLLADMEKQYENMVNADR